MTVNIPSEIIDYLMGDHSRDSKVRVLLYLLAHPEPVTTAGISQAIGISTKAVNRAVKRLAGAGIIQQGNPAPRTRTFIVPGADREMPQKEQPPPSLVDRIDRIEAALARLMDDKGTVPEVERTIPDPEKGHSDPQNARSGVCEGQKLIITHAPASNISLLASSLKEASSLQEFEDLFGVPAPAGADQAAVAEMVKRKKAGKLDGIKSPLGYLASISGKVPAAPDQKARTPQIQNIVDGRLLEFSQKADDIWFSMPEQDRRPIVDGVRARIPQTGRFKVPVELLAKSEFRRQKLAEWGIAI